MPAPSTVVTFVGCFPGLSVAQLGISPGHLREAAEDEIELDRHRLLAPQRAVVVEYGDALFKRHVACSVLDELDDGPLAVAVVPEGERIFRLSDQ